MEKKPSYKLLKEMVEDMKSEISLKENEVEKLKHSFLANISHDIRTPMNVIVGFSNLLSDPSYNVEQKQFFIEEINRNSRELLRLIDNIILTAKYENECIDLNMKEISVKNLFDEIQLIISGKKKFGIQSEIKLSFQSTEIPEKELKFFTDLEILKKVLVNLIENAIMLVEADDMIKYGYHQKGNKIQFFVNRIHNKLKEESRVFEFRNVQILENKKGEITFDFRNGLSVTDKLIKLLGGNLKITSYLEKNTTFNFTLPLNIKNID